MTADWYHPDWYKYFTNSKCLPGINMVNDKKCDYPPPPSKNQMISAQVCTHIYIDLHNQLHDWIFYFDIDKLQLHACFHTHVFKYNCFLVFMEPSLMTVNPLKIQMYKQTWPSPKTVNKCPTFCTLSYIIYHPPSLYIQGSLIAVTGWCQTVVNRSSHPWLIEPALKPQFGWGSAT